MADFTCDYNRSDYGPSVMEAEHCEASLYITVCTYDKDGYPVPSCQLGIITLSGSIHEILE